MQDDSRASAELSRLFDGLALRPGQTEVGIRLPISAVFEREIELPVAAQSQAAEILNFELERSTPFRPEQVYSAHYFGARTPDGRRIVAHQLIAKRALVDNRLDQANAAGIGIQFVDCFRETPEAPLPINLLARSTTIGAEPAEKRHRIDLALTGLIAGLAVTWIFLFFHNQESTLSDLQERLAQVQAKALKVRKAVDATEAKLASRQALVRRRIESPSTVEIIEELTRILPDTAWLSEVRIDQQTLDITGFAKSSAGLVPIVEKSRLFAQTTLSSPVTMDARYGAERFSIHCAIRGAGTPFQTAGSTAAPE